MFKVSLFHVFVHTELGGWVVEAKPRPVLKPIKRFTPTLWQCGCMAGFRLRLKMTYFYIVLNTDENKID